MNLIVRGAYYYNSESDEILIPHYTGEFRIVDCDQYVTMKELKRSYDKKYIAQVIDSLIEYEGKKYYNAEYSPRDVGDWELLSDLSELSHIEESYDF